MAIQKEVRKYIKTAIWENPLAATLTLKQAIPCNGGFVRIDPFHASAALKHAMNIVDRKIYSNHVRNGKRVQRFAVLEGGSRYHYHLLLDVPTQVTAELLAWYAKDAWSRTQWGYDVVDFEPCDMGWGHYITKLSTKEDFASSIDWENVSIRS